MARPKKTEAVNLDVQNPQPTEPTEPAAISAFAFLQERLAVEGFDPYRALAASRDKNTGEWRLFMEASVAMQWFLAKNPEGRAILRYMTEASRENLAVFECTLYVGDKPYGFPGYGQCAFNTNDAFGINFVQTASTKAISCALRNNGFCAPRDAKYIDGVTLVRGDSDMDPNADAGVQMAPIAPPPPGIVPMKDMPAKTAAPAAPPAPAHTKKAPPTAAPAHKAEEKPVREEAGLPAEAQKPVPEPPKPAEAAKPAAEAPKPKAPVAPPPRRTKDEFEAPEGYVPGKMTLEEAENYAFKTGRYAGKTLGEAMRDSAGGKAFVRYFTGERYAGKPVHEAAKLIARNYGF